MMKKILLLLLLSCSLIFVGCTSKNVEGEDASAEVSEAIDDAEEFEAEEGDEDVADIDEEGDFGEEDDFDEAGEGDAVDVADADSDMDDDDFDDEDDFEDDIADADIAEDAIAGEVADATEVAEAGGAGEVVEAGDGSAEMATLDEGVEESFADESFAEEGDAGVASNEGTEEALSADGSSEEFVEAAIDESGFQETPVKTWVPVKKIADAPFTKNGVLVNAVYLARPDDTMESVSQKIYGNDGRTEELYSVNSTLRRGVKVGDKVYYNSANRPNDNSVLVTFYEDIGLQPETYVSQPGDNIREVASGLLGNPGSWKEVWATNPEVESKAEIPEGTRLRYWTGMGGEQGLAQNQAEPADIPPAPADFPPPAPSGNMAQNEMPPPGPADIPPPPAPPGDDSEMPPPPVAANIDAPPPPPPAPPKRARRPPKKAKVEMASSDPDQTMALGAAAILLLAAVSLVVVIRKKKAKRTLTDFANTQTHTQIE